MSLKYKDLASKGVKVAALSCNALGEHQKWLDDVVAHCENKITVDFPISQLPYDFSNAEFASVTVLCTAV
jgi:alkyl hydroperoxide reductase subunit AhpC